MSMAILVLAITLLTLPAAAFPGGEKADGRKIFTLEAVVAAGLDNNPALQARRNETEARKAAWEASRRLANPTLGVEIGKGRPREAEGSVNIGGIALSQVLENPVKRKHRVDAVESEWRAAEHDLRAEETVFISGIKILFARILHLRRLESIARADTESLESMLALVRRRVELGESRELEALKLEVETLRGRNDLHRAQADLHLAREELNAFLGGFLPPDFELAGEMTYEPGRLDETTPLARAEAAHPLILMKGSELAAARSRLSYVRWQRLPDPVLTGFSGEEMDGRKTGIGLSFELPLWDLKSRAAAEAASLVQASESAMRAVRTSVNLDVRAQLNRMRLTARTLDLFRGGLMKQAEESLRIADVSFRQGELSLLDYLDSRRTHYAILRDYEEALFQWKVDRAELEKASGGLELEKISSPTGSQGE
jgi:outer membrane protein, heavy metal efflux system